MEPSSPQRMVRTQLLMLPTCPITTWCPLRLIFWTETQLDPHCPSPWSIVLLWAEAIAPGMGQVWTQWPSWLLMGPTIHPHTMRPWYPEWSNGDSCDEGYLLIPRSPATRSPRRPTQSAFFVGDFAFHPSPPACFFIPGTCSPCSSACRTPLGLAWYLSLLLLLPGAKQSWPPLTPHHSLTWQAQETFHVRLGWVTKFWGILNDPRSSWKWTSGLHFCITSLLWKLDCVRQRECLQKGNCDSGLCLQEKERSCELWLESAMLLNRKSILTGSAHLLKNSLGTISVLKFPLCAASKLSVRSLLC